MPPEDRDRDIDRNTEETVPSEDRDRDIDRNRERQCHQRTETEKLTETERDRDTDRNTEETVPPEDRDRDIHRNTEETVPPENREKNRDIDRGDIAFRGQRQRENMNTDRKT